METLKQQGNDAFKAGKYNNALDLYSKAIAVEESAALYSNRSATHLKLKDAAAALKDADKCIELDPQWHKGWFRKGQALEAQGALDKALAAFESGLKLDPDSKEMADRVEQLKERIAAAQAKAAKKARAAWPGISSDQGHMPGNLPAPDGWARGLAKAQQLEWLVDCYRMRVDDDYAWGGSHLHGLYNPEATKDTIIKDFLVFCKLAVNHGVVPPGWDWSAFLSKAAGLLGYAFEKEDAKDKWGGENVFSAMMGGRSLRYTGEVVYGSSCMAPGNPRDDREKAAQATLEQYERQVEAAFAGGAGGQQLGQHQQLFAEVGGLAAWQQLCRALRFNRSEHVW